MSTDERQCPLSLDDIAAGGYDTVIVAAPDVQGRLFGRRLPARRFLSDPEQGVDICTCALSWDSSQNLLLETPIGGWGTGWPDFRLCPDLHTLRPYPGVARTAICLADSVDESGELLDVAPRTILRRQLERASQEGYQVSLASELEFYLFRGDVRTARKQRFQDLRPTTMIRSDYSIVGQAVEEPFVGRIRREMDAAGIPVFACQAEYGLGQWEVNLEHAGALEMADRHVIYKAGIKEMALQADLAVTFMPKPVATDMGSSCHFHCSLQRDGAPVFPSADSPHDLSSEGRSFLGGMMSRLDDTALFFAPHVNSYKRHGADAAGGINAWAFDNRTATFRVIGSGRSLHIEHRYAGADANPYVAAAAMIAAGLDGIARGAAAGSPITGNAYESGAFKRAPDSLPVAIEAFKSSTFSTSTFGQRVVAHYAAIASGEWEGFLKAVTDWEVMSDFEVV